MRFLIFILVFLTACGPQKSESEIALENFIKELPEIKPGFKYSAVHESPSTVAIRDPAYFQKTFPESTGLVGYSKINDVTCLYTTLISDFISLKLTTFLKGQAVDSEIIGYGYGSDCTIVSVDPKLTMISNSSFELISTSITVECDSTGGMRLPNTEKTTITKTTTTINPDGTISVATKNVQ